MARQAEVRIFRELEMPEMPSLNSVWVIVLDWALEEEREDTSMG